MAQRSSKRRRGRASPSTVSSSPGGPTAATPATRSPPGPAAAAGPAPGVTPPLSRSAQRDADVRAVLRPLEPGERPWPVVIGAALAGLLGAINLISYLAGVKIDGKHPAPGGIIVFSALMLVCAVGVWRMWYGAVLALMALLAIVATIFTLLFVEASNLLGFLVPPVVIAGTGFLFFKLVRTLSRIQMPRPPGR